VYSKLSVLAWKLAGVSLGRAGYCVDVFWAIDGEINCKTMRIAVRERHRQEARSQPIPCIDSPRVRRVYWGTALPNNRDRYLWARGARTLRRLAISLNQKAVHYVDDGDNTLDLFHLAE
jgi:hypothetical protein